MPPNGWRCCEHLEARGVSLEQMVAAHAVGSLHAASTDERLRPGRRISADDVAAAGRDLRRLVAADHARGRHRPPRRRLPGERHRDLLDLRFRRAAMFGEEATLQFTRAVGSSMARVADAALSLFLVNVEGPLRRGGTVGTLLAVASEDAVASLDVIPSLMAGFFRLHMQAAIDRQRVANQSPAIPGVFRLAVGFVDLVGFTPYTEDVGHDELAGFVERFEARANERGGRASAAGWSSTSATRSCSSDADPTNACEIALQPRHAFGGEAGVSPHAGRRVRAVRRSRGRLLRLGGEPRLTHRRSRGAGRGARHGVGRAGGVGSAASFAFEPAGRRMLKGFAVPIPLWSVTRSRPAP